MSGAPRRAAPPGLGVHASAVLDWFGLTDPGRERTRNQDQYLVAELDKTMLIQGTSLSVEDSTRLFARLTGWLLAVADGMGGTPAGDHASRLAIETIVQYTLNAVPWFMSLSSREDDDVSADLKRVLSRCEAVLEADASLEPERRGMGTTVVMAYVVFPRLYVVHAGDSRCYLLRDDELARITRDHTLAAELAEQSRVPLETLAASPLNSMLSNAVTTTRNTKLSPELRQLNLRPGDQLLLCTDGLTGELRDDAIRDIMAAAPNARAACERLVAAANDAGGRDNITAVVARL